MTISKNYGTALNTVFFLAGLILLAFLLRLFALWLFPIVQRDGILYLEMMNVWNETNSYQEVLKNFRGVNWIPPFPLFLMKLLMPLGFSAECSAKVLCIGFGSLLPAIGYGIAWTLTKRQLIAVASGVLFAVHPVLIEFSIQPLRDGFYLFWAGLTLLFLCRGMINGKWYDWFAAGVFSAASFLTRYETLEFYLLIFVFLICAPLFQSYPWRRALTHGFVFAAGLVVTLFLVHCLMGTGALFVPNYWSYYQEKWRHLKRIWNI